MSDHGISFRTGIGYDAHRLVDGRNLVLGGVTIPHEKGLLGHSDADVLVHAVIDALLGALGEGDIGRHFPDSSPEYKDISSILLLEQIRNLMSGRPVEITWVDSVIVAEKPKLGPYIPQIEQALSLALGISSNRVNVKAKTTEKMGFTGRREGIAAQVVVTLKVAE